MNNHFEIEKILKKNPIGLTITEIVERSNFSRSTIRTILARLEGAQKISYKKIGMAKVYTLCK
jgi:predicted transcriptional regulator